MIRSRRRSIPTTREAVVTTLAMTTKVVAEIEVAAVPHVAEAAEAVAVAEAAEIEADHTAADQVALSSLRGFRRGFPNG